MAPTTSAVLRIPSAIFVDFLTSTGRSRVAIVRSLKRGQGYDFYRPLVRELQAMHERAGTLRPDQAARQLADLVPPLVTVDARKAKIYPRLADGYAKALNGMGPTTWATPSGATPFRLPVAGDVELEVTPDLVLRVEDDVTPKPRTHLLTLSMPVEPLAEHRAALVCFLMREASGAGPETVCGVLDVPRSRMLTDSPKGALVADMRALIRAEATCFRALWEALPSE